MCRAGVVASGPAFSHERMSRMADRRSGGRPKTPTVTPPSSTDGVEGRKTGGEGGDLIEELCGIIDVG